MFSAAAAATPATVDSHPARLALRPPTASEMVALRTLIDAPRRGLGGRNDALAVENHPALDSGSGKPASGVEAMAQRFRHEGLPVARLWENHAAFVSLGLSPRGKPGLWLVQKIR